MTGGKPSAPDARRPAPRLAGALLPLLVVAAVVLTANHSIVDAVGGTLLVRVSRHVVRRVERPPASAAPRPAIHLPGQRRAGSRASRG